MRWILTEAAGVGTEDREESLSLCLVPTARPLLGNPATAASDHQPAAMTDNTRCHYTGTSRESRESESANERRQHCSSSAPVVPQPRGTSSPLAVVLVSPTEVSGQSLAPSPLATLTISHPPFLLSHGGRGEG